MADRYGFMKYGTYDSNTMTVNNAVTNYDAKTTGGAFTNRTLCDFVSIRTDQTITVKMGATTNDAITITSTDSPFEFIGWGIENLFISNASGSNATVQILNA